MAKHPSHTTLYTPWTTTSVTLARNSSVHAGIHLHMPTLRSSEVEILNFLKLPYNAQGNGRFATVSQGHIRISDISQRKGVFITAGHTPCTV